MSNYIDYSDDYTPSDTEKLEALQPKYRSLKSLYSVSVIFNLILVTLLVVLFFLNYSISLKAGILKKSSVEKPVATATIAPTKAAVLTPKPTATSAPKPTPTPTRIVELFNKLEYESSELSTGERATIVINIRHNGCFKSDLNDCDGQVVSLMSADKKAYYVNDFGKRLSYLVLKDWVTIKWSTNLHIFTKNVFRIATPTP